MLNQNQRRKLETIDCWLREIRQSEEFRQLEYCPDVTLGDAIQAVGELLQEHNHCDYKPASPKSEVGQGIHLPLILMCQESDHPRKQSLAP